MSRNQPKPLSKPAKLVDRRVLRTQLCLRDALLQLVLEQGWDAVSVQAVCERAGIGRSTFYVHYADKEELLLSGFDALLGELRAHLRSSGGDRLGFVAPLVAHVDGHRRLYRALAGKRSAHNVRRRLLEVICSVLEDEASERARTTAAWRAAARYGAGACVELIGYWLDGRTGLAAAEIERLLYQLTSAVVREAEGHGS